jgi:hypothetical protein
MLCCSWAVLRSNVMCRVVAHSVRLSTSNVCESQSNTAWKLNGWTTQLR